MKTIVKSILIISVLISTSSIAAEPVNDPKISYLLNKTNDVNCQKFRGVIRKNCELTTAILNTTYSEYCSTTKCESASIEDMMAWLELKKSIISKIKASK